jgi:Mrp family chromosome partitioning ATPase
VEVAIKLARALAESKRTLLIDGTFHGNSLSESFVFEQEASNSMEQPTVLDQSVRTRQDSDLHYLPLCRSQSTRHALLEKSFNQQISGMRNNYEWILVITDPFSLGPEAVLWSHIADSTVMVAEAGRTKGESIRMAYRALKHHHKRVLGVVLNNANPKLNRKYSAGFKDFPSDVTTRQA